MWEHFYELSRIPRCSREEEEVRDYIIKVAERNNLKHKMDQVGNLVVKKPAAKGLENKPVIVFQGHLDMVCEKNKDTKHDFKKDPIKLKREGDWLKADGTTLGSDNGIGVAAALAWMEDKETKTGPLEFLFTIDEETGLTGARELSSDMLDGKILLNMDSEEDGALYIGCAGGKDAELFLSYESEKIPSGFEPVLIKITGLMGGHSGLNIHEGRGNAIKLLNRFLWKALPQVSGRLASIEGGSKHNAIPREAEAIIFLPKDKKSDLKKLVQEYNGIFKDEYKPIDPKVELSMSESGFDVPEQMYTSQLHNRLLNLLYSLPHGVMAMSHAIEGLVETSTNLAVLSRKNDDLAILTSQRSSVGSELTEIHDMILACGYLAGAQVKSGGGYPAWKPNPDSSLLKRAKKVYKNLFGKEPEVKAIHAGLECGIIGDKFPGMDMISFGPTIMGAHSPDERVQISTVEKFWKFLDGLVKDISSQTVNV
ncbi:MAG: aminoacyl-histidine dipeptidase [Calditrichaeota bacterium]|nr:aminoacyl-histidine dipeptidase [Calditrichota bacterium]RQW07920.1 MAG: aminoacyl-histidine dipeptidase [Calditrichota bacterium]